jgi:hypothetical protein
LLALVLEFSNRNWSHVLGNMQYFQPNTEELGDLCRTS